MATGYRPNEELLQRAIAAQNNTVRLQTRPRAAAPSTGMRRTSSAADAYNKMIGFNQRDMPEFWSDRPRSEGFLSRYIFNPLTRATSGSMAAIQGIGNRQIEARKNKRLFIPNTPAEIARMGRDFYKGVTGDTIYTGKSTISNIYDNPYVRSQVDTDFERSAMRVIDNPKFRSVAGFGLEMFGDATNYIPIGAPLKAIGKPGVKAAKAIGKIPAVNKVVSPVGRHVIEPVGRHIVQPLGKKVGMFRPKEFNEMVSQLDKSRALASEIGSLTNKFMEGKLSNRQIVQYKASIKGILMPIVGEKQANQMLKGFSKRLEDGLQAAEKFKAQGKTLDQKKLYEYLIGVGDSKVDDVLDPIIKGNDAGLTKRIREFVGGKFEPYKKNTITLFERANKKTATFVKNKLGLDVGDFKHELDNYSVRHALNRHAKDAIPLKPEDFELIPTIIKKADNILYSGKDEAGRDLIMYEKVIGDKIAYLEEIRTGRKTLTMKTMYWKKKAPTGANYAKKPSSVRSSVNTPRQQLDAYGRSIAPALDNVKSARALQAADEIYRQVAGTGRSLQDEIISPLLSKTGAVSDEVLARGEGEYMRKLYEAGDNVYNQIGLPARGGKGYGAEIGATKMSKRTPLRAIEYLTENSTDEAKSLLKKFDNELKKQGDTLANRNEIADKLEPQLKKIFGDDYKKFALDQRRASGLLDEANLAAAMSAEQGLDLAVTTKFLNEATKFAVDGIDETAAMAQGLKRIPDTAKYGAMGGKFVPDTIYDDLVGIIDPSNGQWKQVLNAWKQLKLFSPLNFASNFRNQIGDMVLNSSVEGGPSILKQLTLLPKAIQDYRVGGELFQKMTEKGVFASTFASQEVRNQTAKRLGRAADNTLGAKISRGADRLTSKNLKTPVPGVGFGKEAYEYTSEVNKMVQVMHQMSKGKSLDEAIEMAAKATFDYSKLPVGMRKIRDNYMPFMTFKYFAAQLAVDTLINRTGKIATIPKARRLIEGFSEDTRNDADLPQYMRDNREMFLRTPFKDAQGNPRYLDLTYMYPFGDIAGGLAPHDLILGNPFVRLPYELSKNESIYFGSPIVDEHDSAGTRARERAMYILEQLGPKPGFRELNKVYQGAKKTEDRYGRQQSLGTAIPDVTFGVKMRDVNPDLQRGWNTYQTQQELQDIRAKMRKIATDPNMSERKKASELERLQLLYYQTATQQ